MFPFPTEPEPANLTDWMDAAEAATAEAFEQALADEAALDGLAGAWRASFAAGAGVDPRWRAAVPGFADLERGGTNRRGGLDADHPTGLSESCKALWAAALQTLSMQQLAMPWVTPNSAQLSALAQKVGAEPNPAFAPTPTEVVWQGGGYRLRRVLTDDCEGEPVVVISSLINRWYILDFLEGQSFLAAVASLGRPTYLLEGLPPGKEPDDRSLGDLCAGPILAAIDHVRAGHKTDQASVIGYCMGGTLAAALTARYPERVSRLATVCGPVKFSEGGLFTRWFAPRYLDVGLVTSGCNAVPAWLVHLPFWWLRPSIKTQKMSRLVRSGEKPGYITRFLAAEIWNHDNMDMARGVFRSWAGDLYQQDQLAEGRFMVDGEPVDLARITCPVAVISGEHDAITPPASCEALTELSNPSWQRLLRARASHTGVLSAPRVVAEVTEALGEWLAAPTKASKKESK